MAISAKSRSRHVLIEEASADESLNDNNPGMHPGHELSDLHNVQRQPAGEQVIHYARAAQISSFPDHPEAAPASSVTPPPMDAAVEKQEDEKKPVQRRLTVTCICSLIFHATLAAALFVAYPEALRTRRCWKQVKQSASLCYGSSDADESAAGETETSLFNRRLFPKRSQPDTIQPDGSGQRCSRSRFSRRDYPADGCKAVRDCSAGTGNDASIGRHNSRC